MGVAIDGRGYWIHDAVRSVRDVWRALTAALYSHMTGINMELVRSLSNFNPFLLLD